ncbi:MAG: cell division ATP-binding protein FtsE [Trueperaceae bacterium]|nr:cell division ATP-binding protein FtsE [Trueperaceae bacterium]
MIQFQEVTKTYSRSHTHALQKVSFIISQGEFVYVTGHSGAGKSTLLSLILRRIQPSEGSVYILGQDLSKLKDNKLPLLRRKLGMVFQDHRLLSHLSAIDNVIFVLRATGEKGDLEGRALRALRQVGLAHKRKAFPVELSLGEQQRVAIARALVTNPPVLLCDEPTGNLDPDTSWEVLELLNDVNLKGTTVLLATHSRELVDQLRKRTIVLRNGRVVRDDEKGGYSL